MSDTCAAITVRGKRYPTQLMCAALEVSASCFGVPVQRAFTPPSPRAVRWSRRCLIVQRMSRRGNSSASAVAETFFATQEHELLATADFQSRHESEHAIATSIDDWYNSVRRHSTPSYLSPKQYERRLRAADTAASRTRPFLWVESSSFSGARVSAAILNRM